MNARGILVVLIIICFFGLPIFPYAHYGWGVPGGLFSILIVLLLLSILGII